MLASSAFSNISVLCSNSQPEVMNDERCTVSWLGKKECTPTDTADHQKYYQSYPIDESDLSLEFQYAIEFAIFLSYLLHLLATCFNRISSPSVAFLSFCITKYHRIALLEKSTRCSFQFCKIQKVKESGKTGTNNGIIASK